MIWEEGALTASDGVPEANQRVHNGHSWKQPCCPWVSGWRPHEISGAADEKTAANDTGIDIDLILTHLTDVRSDRMPTSTPLHFTSVFISSLPMLGSADREHTQWNQILIWFSHQNQMSQWNPHYEIIMRLYLVGGLEHFLFSHILGIIISIDFHIFQRVGPTTNQIYNSTRFLSEIPGRASAVSSRRDSAHSRGLNLPGAVPGWDDPWNDVKRCETCLVLIVFDPCCIYIWWNMYVM